jgi:ubiquinone/menaquinone biosynthesis C-methylase UbiE
MKAAFDDSADGYDAHFTNTSIGRLQRNKVWLYLEKVYGAAFPPRVLELNCGTGEDAVFFAKRGSTVLATDVSENMLLQTAKKAAHAGMGQLVQTQQVDLTRFPGEISQRFELIFSAFGGVNCINEFHLQQLLERSTRLLTPGGRIIIVVMPRFCAWETVYFSARLNFKNAFRRRAKHPVKANLGNNLVDTWYYAPGQVKRIASQHYKIVNIQPIGITIPPSYLQKTFLTRTRILDKLDALENNLGRFSFLARLADHYLIDLELK